MFVVSEYLMQSEFPPHPGDAAPMQINTPLVLGLSVLFLSSLSGEFLVLCRSALSTPGRDSGDISLEALLFGAVSAGGEFDESVQRHLHPGTLLLGHVHEVGVDAAEDSLVGNDDDILTALQFHDDGLKADDDVAVGLTATVAVVVLVFITGSEILGVFLSDFFVGQAVANARVKFVQGFPLQLLIASRSLEVTGTLNSTTQSRSPDYDLGVVRDTRLAQQLGKCAGVGFAALGDVRVASNTASQVELGFTVLFSSVRLHIMVGNCIVLTYSGEPDGTRLDVNILDVVDQTAGQVIFDLVDDDGRSHVDELDVGVLLLIFVDGFVHLLVVANAVAEIKGSDLRILTLVVRGGRLDFLDVSHDEIFVITDGLHKESLNASFSALLIDPLAALLGGVGGIQDGDNTLAGLEPLKHVRHGSLCGSSAHAFTLFIVGVKEGGSWLRVAEAAIATNVEDTGRDTDPTQIAHG